MMYAGVPAWLFLAVIAPPWNCWNTTPLSRVPALRMDRDVACQEHSCCVCRYQRVLGSDRAGQSHLIAALPDQLHPGAGGEWVLDVEVALAAAFGGAEASVLFPLLQPRVISAAAATPTTAARRFVIVLMSFPSRLPHRGFPSSERTYAVAVIDGDPRRQRSITVNEPWLRSLVT